MIIYTVGSARKGFLIEEKEVEGIGKFGQACYSTAKDDRHRSRVAEFEGFFFTSKEDAKNHILKKKKEAKQKIINRIAELNSQINLIDKDDFKLDESNRSIYFAFGFIAL